MQAQPRLPIIDMHLHASPLKDGEPPPVNPVAGKPSAARTSAELRDMSLAALNHILSPGQLQQVFHRVAGILNPGGLFVFDISTEHWFRWLHEREKLFKIGRNYMMASNRYDPKSRLVEFRQLWFIPRGRRYERRLVRVRERPYTAGEIRVMARRSGFRVLAVRRQWVLDGKTVRLAFVLERKP